MSGCYGMTACGMGEPKVYGGYGMGATAEQEIAPPKPKPKEEKNLPVYGDDDKAPWEKSHGAPCKCLQTGQTFTSLIKAAEATGIDYKTLRAKLRRHDQTTISGYTIVRC